MQIQSNRFIAHIRQSDKCVQYVDEHNDNVAELAAIIAEQYSIANLAKLAGRHHDAGKNTHEFTSYIKAAAEGEKVVRGSVIHSTHGALLVNELATSKSNSILTAELVRTVILSHHGLRDCLTPEGDAVFAEALEKIKDSYPGVKETVYDRYGTDFIKKEFLEACRDTRFIATSIQELIKKHEKLGSPHFYLSMFTRLLTSIVIDADRTDTACFEDNISLPRRKTPNELRQMWKSFLNHFEEKLMKLQTNKEPSKLDPYRSEISRSCAEFDGGEAGVFRLVVPCGAGKTLAALRYALQTAHRYGKERIFYIAPFNSILEQNAAEIANLIGSTDAVLEHHSNIIFEAEQLEDMKRYQSLIDNWAQSPFIATTAVQFLNTLFAAKTSSIRRMQALGNAIIIIDEIQALPIKVLKLFNGAMNFLASFCKTSVVLCSATQPLLHSLDNYRILKPQSIIENEEKYTEPFRRVEIKNCLRERGFSTEEAGQFILEQVESAKSILAIVNTKTCARKIYKYLRDNILKGNEGQYRLFHLSTNMCPAHRRDVLQNMRTLLEETDSNIKIICISTSLIEAGVDVSFERVVRSLAGLDSIIQAAGRCNRHNEAPYGIVSIINIKEEKIGNLGNLKQAQDATRELLFNIKNAPERYPEGLLSKAAMEEFYARFFHSLQKEMAYNLKYYPEYTMLDILSNNPLGKKEFNKKYQDMNLPMMKQAFKEAGETFAVIDEEAKVDVFINYDCKAREVLEKLKAATTFQEKRVVMRQLQPYIVQLRENEWLKRERSTMDYVGILVLPQGYYDNEYGVDETIDVKMETLII